MIELLTLMLVLSLFKNATFDRKSLSNYINQIPERAKGQVLIQLSYAALNHLDLWIWKEQTLDKEVISGSDGSGVVRAVGEGISFSLKLT